MKVLVTGSAGHLGIEKGGLSCVVLYRRADIEDAVSAHLITATRWRWSKGYHP